MINGSKNTMGQMNTGTNVNKQQTQINGREHYIPSKRRMSSVGSIGSVNSTTGATEETIQEAEVIKKVLHEPNNRVNF